MVRIFTISAVAVACVSPLAAASKEVFEFVQKSRAGCHNATVKAGNIDLKSLQTEKTFEEDRATWERVVEKLKTGQMPPPGAVRPLEATVAAITRSLESEFARQDLLIKPGAGRVNARRLNRAEYNNSIRDLLGIDIRPADKFPADTAAFGFDNISDALNLSPALLENYVDAAERAVRTALFGPERRKPSAVHYSAPVRINDSRGRSSLPKDLFDYDLTGLSTLHSAHFIHRFPVDAEYSFRLVLNGHRPNQSEPAHPAFFIDGALAHEFEVDATDLEGQIVEFRTKVKAGERLLSASYLRNYHGLPPSYGGPEPSQRPEVALINPRGKLTEKDIETLRKYGTKIKTDSVEKRVDNRYESIDVGGPFNQATAVSPESIRRIYVCGHAPGKHTDACARKILTSFTIRAFRRPVTSREVEQYLGFVTLARKQGDSFEEGIATALQAVLVSPDFLYRIERDRPATPGHSAVPVSPYELASRLSYFLWSSMPDEELLRAAGQGSLRRRSVLDAQVKRMLRDRKSAALVENFAGQWLQFKNIDVLRPDLERFPMFDDGLRQAMRRETELFVENIIRNEGSVLELLDANYTFLNERLARFYGIRGVTGPEFRRVDVSGSERGGGILAHASVLTVSSYSTRTSPVLRGKWILENLLNAPPPAPPPGVPPLDETKTGQSGTLRQQMEEHRKNPACSSCHARMDPLGFGLENFNAIGAWRTQDGRLPVDASGVLPDGRSFRTPAELKALLMADRDVFVRGLTEKLLIYALGRGLERYDRPTVAEITAKLPAQEYRFSQLVLGIVNSLPFPNGVIMKDWKLAETGRDFAFTRILKPLERFRDDITVLSGLANHAAEKARGCGHAKATGSFLSGAPPKYTAGPDVRAGVTFDQLAAQRWASETRVASLQIGCEDSRMVGNCDTGSSCAYTNSLSWKDPETPLPVEVNPQSIFERLFGSADPSLPADVRARRTAYRKSILDRTRENTRALMLDLGPADRRRMDEYLTGVREVESRIAAAEKDPLAPPIEKPSGIPFEYRDYVKLMFDLQVIAFQADLTRVSTMMLGREGSVRTYPEIGVPDPHHPLTHHRGHPDFIEKVTKINSFHVELFAGFVERLKATPDGDGALLDHSVVLYGSALSDGNAHSNSDLPLLVAGHAGGLRGGRHIAAEAGTPVANLFVNLLNCIGIETERFADSTGQLDLRA